MFWLLGSVYCILGTEGQVLFCSARIRGNVGVMVRVSV